MRLYKYFITFVLLGVISFHSLRQGVLTAYYMVANDSFVEILCENKDKPELSCDGKCVFSKMIAEQQSEMDNVPFEFLKPYQIPLYFQTSPDVELITLSILAVSSAWQEKNYTSLKLDADMQPPEMV
ncbi:MAG: hypothetical protein OIF50_07980 [Flavobacteriaceae bacterium]|nr:hypothetical protein [Flavobacteriaceae bacterium]